MEKAKFTLRLEKEKLQELKILAVRMDMPVNELIEKALEHYQNEILELDKIFDKK